MYDGPIAQKLRTRTRHNTQRSSRTQVHARRDENPYARHTYGNNPHMRKLKRTEGTFVTVDFLADS